MAISSAEIQGHREGVRGQKSDTMYKPSYVNPYDAGAAGEGTHKIPTHGIPSLHLSPGPALSVDSAAALTPIINDVERRSPTCCGAAAPEWAGMNGDSLENKQRGTIDEQLVFSR